MRYSIVISSSVPTRNIRPKQALATYKRAPYPELVRRGMHPLPIRDAGRAARDIANRAMTISIIKNALSLEEALRQAEVDRLGVAIFGAVPDVRLGLRPVQVASQVGQGLDMHVVGIHQSVEQLVGDSHRRAVQRVPIETLVRCPVVPVVDPGTVDVEVDFHQTQ